MGAVYFGDLKNTALVGQLEASATVTSTTTGTGVDFILGDGSNTVAILNVSLYDITSGDETYAIQIQESVDNSTNWTACTGLDGGNFTTKTSAGGDLGTAYIQVINFFRSKRYLRMVATLGGTTPSLAFGIVAMEPLKIVNTSSSPGGYSPQPTNPY